MSGYIGSIIAPPSWLRRDPNIPWWCGLSDWTGGWAEACRPATPEQIRAGQRSEIGPAMTPENVRIALAQGDRAVAAYCMAHPEECADYQAGQTNWLVWVAVGAATLALLVGR